MGLTITHKTKRTFTLDVDGTTVEVSVRAEMCHPSDERSDYVDLVLEGVRAYRNVQQPVKAKAL